MCVRVRGRWHGPNGADDGERVPGSGRDMGGEAMEPEAVDRPDMDAALRFVVHEPLSTGRLLCRPGGCGRFAPSGRLRFVVLRRRPNDAGRVHRWDVLRRGPHDQGSMRGCDARGDVDHADVDDAHMERLAQVGGSAAGRVRSAQRRVLHRSRRELGPGVVPAELRGFGGHVDRQRVAGAHLDQVSLRGDGRGQLGRRRGSSAWRVRRSAGVDAPVVCTDRRGRCTGSAGADARHACPRAGVRALQSAPAGADRRGTVRCRREWFVRRAE
jgi:hypothetical protein